MTYVIEQHPTLPLLVTTFSGYVDADEFVRWNTELLARASALGLSHSYVLMDIRQADTDFAAIVQGLTRMSQAVQQTPNAIETFFAFLGSHPMARLSVDMMRQPQYGGFDVPIFLTYEDAVAAFEADMKLRQQRTQDAK
ncbi:MAG: hypothetical protein NZ750_04940 [Anaerolineae bacterium]|nr:hypothetical protein [Anaerolineae bacterium]MDW8173806.1 hypothetical protein [Anaerolineae bacterium]